MARRTINIPDAIDAQVRTLAQEGESFSAAVTRMIEAGMKAVNRGKVPSYVGSGKGPEDLGLRAEAYLRELVSSK